MNTINAEIQKVLNTKIVDDSEMGSFSLHVIDDDKNHAVIDWRYEPALFRTAKRMFPQLEDVPNDSFYRISGIYANGNYRGKGVGQILLLRALNHVDGAWFYNSQAYSPAHVMYRRMESAGLIDLIVYREMPTTEDIGLHAMRITDKGKRHLEKLIQDTKTENPKKSFLRFSNFFKKRNS